MAEVTFQEVTAYVEDRAKTIVSANQKSLALEREERLRISMEQMSRVGRLEKDITAIRTKDLPEIKEQLAVLVRAAPNGWRTRGKQVGLITLMTAILNGVIYLWKG